MSQGEKPDSISREARRLPERDQVRFKVLLFYPGPLQNNIRGYSVSKYCAPAVVHTAQELFHNFEAVKMKKKKSIPWYTPEELN